MLDVLMRRIAASFHGHAPGDSMCPYLEAAPCNIHEGHRGPVLMRGLCCTGRRGVQVRPEHAGAGDVQSGGRDPATAGGAASGGGGLRASGGRQSAPEHLHKALRRKHPEAHRALCVRVDGRAPRQHQRRARPRPDEGGLHRVRGCNVVIMRAHKLRPFCCHCRWECLQVLETVWAPNDVSRAMYLLCDNLSSVWMLEGWHNSGDACIVQSCYCRKVWKVSA